MENKEKELREEFQNFADCIIWSNDDGSEKYIGVGNMADWWIKKIDLLLREQSLIDQRKADIDENSKTNTRIYFALIEMYNQHKSMFPGFGNEADFASFIDNQIS